jgi:hypothetical protein
MWLIQAFSIPADYRQVLWLTFRRSGDRIRLIQASSRPADWTGLMVEFRWSVDRMRLIQASSRPADWTGLMVEFR